MTTPYDRWKLGMSLITINLGPDEDRRPELRSALANAEPADLVTGTLDVASKLLAMLAHETKLTQEDILQLIARQAAEQFG